jgi:hypothetical protein
VFHRYRHAKFAYGGLNHANAPAASKNDACNESGQIDSKIIISLSLSNWVKQTASLK